MSAQIKLLTYYDFFHSASMPCILSKVKLSSSVFWKKTIR